MITHSNIISQLIQPSLKQPKYIFDDTTLTKYRKGIQLGGGGFGEVYEFIETKTNKIYACKIIPIQSIESSPQNTFSFINENKFNNILNYEFICKCFNTFKDNTNFSFLLEYHPNKTLNELLNTRYNLTEFEVKHYGYQILLAIEYLHSKNIIHRDLKLSNVLLTESLEIRVCDFGLAIENGGDVQYGICGTPNYIAPEVLMKKKANYGFEVDLWSFGVMLYTLLFHNTPFEEEGKGRTRMNIINVNYSFPKEITVSEDAKNLIKKLLVKEPYARLSVKEIKRHIFFNCGINIPKELPKYALEREMSELEIKEVIRYAQENGKTMECYNINEDEHSLLEYKHEFINTQSFVREKCISCINEVDNCYHSEDKISSNEKVLNINKNELINNKYKSCLCKTYKIKQIKQLNLNIVMNEKTSVFDTNNSTGTINTQLLTCNSSSSQDNHRKILTPRLGFIDDNHINTPSSISNTHEHISMSVQEQKSIFTTFTFPFPFITTFSDRSDQYGLFFTFDNHITGVCFNDKTNMLIKLNNNTFTYITSSLEIQHYSLKYFPNNLQNKLKLLIMYAKNTLRNRKYGFEKNDDCNIYIRKWAKGHLAYFFSFTNNIVQVVFNDRTELFFCLKEKNVMFLDKARKILKYKLGGREIMNHNEMNKRVKYAYSILSQG